MSNTILLRKLCNYEISENGLYLFLYDSEGEIAPEIHVVYENEKVLVFYTVGYFLLNMHGHIEEQNTYKILESRSIEDLQNVNYEVVRALHTLTYGMLGRYTDCKFSTIQTIIIELKNAYPNKDISKEVNLLNYLNQFYENINQLGGIVNPYNIKLASMRQ